MLDNGNPNGWGKPSDPFREGSFLLPHEEETWARVEQLHQDNRDALQHHVELLVWETHGGP